MRYRLYILLSLVLLALPVQARQKRIFGYVLDSENRGIELANVYIEGTTNGTTTNRNGYYDLQLQTTDSITLVYEMLGFKTIRQTILPRQDVLQINVVLPTDVEALQEVEVRGIRRQQDMMDHLEMDNVRLMPDASGGSIESLLITFAGVSQNNELSSQYNVRGGSFDENEVYVNGIEVHRPLLIRAGQQEGLSFVNPLMVENVQFSAGGYDAQYGDKMSSVLDITYKRPQQFESTLSASILGASAYVGVGNERYSMMHGIRYKTSQYMLGALPTTGNYKPNFVDYQTFITWKLDRQSRWEMSFLGNFSQNSYSFQPDSMAESFGTFTNAKHLVIYYDGQEKDMFRTAFGAFNVTGQINKNLKIGFDLSGFYTNEQETYDITGEYILSDNPMDGQTSLPTRGVEGINADSASAAVLGTGVYHEHARNRLQAGVIAFAHTGEWQKESNTLKWGTSIQAELISDHISEWEWRDSMGYSLPNDEHAMELYYSMRGQTKMQSLRWQGYVQDTYKWYTDHGKVLLTGGLRFNYWTYNREFLCSPRLSLTYIPGWKRDFSFRFATGLYYQSPFYKELRDTITDETGVTRITLNDKLRAQRSVHVVLGGDYYFRAWGRPFKLTAEAYYKYMDRVVSYTVDNVRVRYSGVNDAKAYSTGLDLKLYGELVPGADSWISFSTMRARENLLTDDRGWIPGPNEQRYSFSMLFEDYIPRLPQYRVQVKFIWADGLPFGSPRNTATRAAFRTPSYKRLDIGASWVFAPKYYKFMQKSKHVKQWTLQFEVFNIVGFRNVNSYFWVSTVSGEQYASPNYLTGRMFNGKITVDFK